MPINPDAVGSRGAPVRSSWSSKDSLLYAVGVGAGQEPTDPAELPFVTENSIDVTPRALPTMAVVLADVSGAFGDIGSFNPAMLVHGEQRVVCHAELPTSGELESTSEITAIWDKGKGAVIEVTAHATSTADGSALFDLVMSAFIRGEGGFGGERIPSPPSRIPERAPDFERVVATRPDQALLYRLSGDRNPLHSDPAFASRGGFSRPILHGMCTYGITGRILLNEFCGGEPDRLRSMQGRFTRPVLPGDVLKVQAWKEADGIRFRTLAEGGQPVLDQGLIGLAP
jgi:acyl dehydratase